MVPICTLGSQVCPPNGTLTGYTIFKELTRMTNTNTQTILYAISVDTTLLAQLAVRARNRVNAYMMPSRVNMTRSYTIMCLFNVQWKCGNDMIYTQYSQMPISCQRRMSLYNLRKAMMTVCYSVISICSPPKKKYNPFTLHPSQLMREKNHVIPRC